MSVHVLTIKFDMGVCDDAQFLLDEFIEEQEVVTVESWSVSWDKSNGHSIAHLVPFFNVTPQQAYEFSVQLQARWNFLAE